ncbi:hypothetical protein G9A89_020714 [Geosiphon pyriformis]|nr:hypothetical protein G9A89_020714 [Geosiphon pyriformis]
MPLETFHPTSAIIFLQHYSYNISFTDLPIMAQNPQFEAEKVETPEFQTNLGRLVRMSQKQHPECIIFVRVGCFWEVFFEQAIEVGPKLNLKIIKRKLAQEWFPCIGFPAQHLEKHTETLVNDGYSIALCDEFRSDGSQYGNSKFTRRITRIITPGTLIDENFLELDRNNFLLGISFDEVTEATGLAWVDISTGEFFMQRSSVESLSNDVARISPKEILLSEIYRYQPNNSIWNYIDQNLVKITFQSQDTFDVTEQQSWEIEMKTNSVVCPVFSPVELQASAGLFNYVNKNLVDRTLKLESPIRVNPEETMIIDATALHSLEIIQSMRDNIKQGSLLYAIQKTKTPSGARTLHRWLCLPSTSIELIKTRQDLVEYFFKNTHLTSDIRHFLEDYDDAQRITQRLSLQRGGPELFLKLKQAIKAMKNIQLRMNKELEIHPDFSVETFINRIESQDDLIEKIDSAIDEEALIKMQASAEENDGILEKAIESDLVNSEKKAVTNKPETSRRKKTSEIDHVEMQIKSDNWCIKSAFLPAVAKLHRQLKKLYKDQFELQEKWRASFNLPSLELKSTPNYGFIVTIRDSDHQSFVESLQATCVRKTKSQAWFLVQQWTHIGGELETLKFKIREEESKAFSILRGKVIEHWNLTVQNSFVIDELDVTSSLAVLAREQNFVRPILNNGTAHDIIGGRHPIVEAGLQIKNRIFTKNDCCLNEQERVWLITGPNMGGKSTFLRQNALISILAQIGSFVPADFAEIGIVDQIFCRVGASDNLYQNQSTFMVEMMETSHILKHATSRSFVIMDEVGRGTNTMEGLAISFATLYHLHYLNRSRTLFATHFHELADMIKNFESIGCYCTAVQEREDGGFHYVHLLGKGVNQNSSALKVAQLAGMPLSVLTIARQALDYLNKNKQSSSLDQSFINEISNNNRQPLSLPYGD